MAIKILMLVFAAVLFFISTYLWHHRQRPFLVFDPVSQPAIARLVSFWAIELAIVGFLSIAGIFNFIIMIIALILGSLSTMALGLMLVQLMNRS
ncbi:hypothetical protein [Furfurilactobacillus curtus]|uniref:Integral membrane protein n=1 Tax=Furfurilactobacillus curtus TaxID=1746200 RepID=A0ABQ5JT09_9LACO